MSLMSNVRPSAKSRRRERVLKRCLMIFYKMVISCGQRRPRDISIELRTQYLENRGTGDGLQQLLHCETQHM